VNTGARRYAQNPVPATVRPMSNPRSAFGVTIGDRVELIAMPNDPHPVRPGTRGTVTHLCDTRGMEQIGVAWDDGRSLAIIPGTDRWRRIS